MSQFSVTYQRINSTIQQLTNLNRQFKSAVNTLESTERQLNGMWEGEAKQAFDRAFHSDKVQMDNFYNALQQYINVLTNSLSEYQRTEGQNTQIANSRNYR